MLDRGAERGVGLLSLVTGTVTVVTAVERAALFTSFCACGWAGVYIHRCGRRAGKKRGTSTRHSQVYKLFLPSCFTFVQRFEEIHASSLVDRTPSKTSQLENTANARKRQVRPQSLTENAESSDYPRSLTRTSNGTKKERKYELQHKS